MITNIYIKGWSETVQVHTNGYVGQNKFGKPTIQNFKVVDLNTGVNITVELDESSLDELKMKHIDDALKKEEGMEE